MQLSFDELEECSQILKNLQAKQGKLSHKCERLQDDTRAFCDDVKTRIEEIQSKVDKFVAETKAELDEKKSKLIKDLQAGILNLKKQQEKSANLVKSLQRESVEWSKEIQTQLDSTENKLQDAVHLKTSFLNFYNAQCKVSILISCSKSSNYAE